MSKTATSTRPQAPARRPVEHDLLLTALPHPILVLAEENRIVYANAAAEAFLSTGIALLKRVRLDDVLGFGCPLLALVEQVRRSGSTLNEYSVEIATPKLPGPKLVDVYGGPFADQPGLVVLMLQQRNMAQMIGKGATVDVDELRSRQLGGRDLDAVLVERGARAAHLLDKRQQRAAEAQHIVEPHAL